MYVRYNSRHFVCTSMYIFTTHVQVPNQTLHYRIFLIKVPIKSLNFLYVHVNALFIAFNHYLRIKQLIHYFIIITLSSKNLCTIWFSITYLSMILFLNLISLDIKILYTRILSRTSHMLFLSGIYWYIRSK